MDMVNGQFINPSWEYVSDWPISHDNYVGMTRSGKSSYMMMMMLDNKKLNGNVEPMEMSFEEVRAEMDRKKAEIELLQNLIDDYVDAGTDEYQDGTVIKFNKPQTIRGIIRNLEYVAIKKNDAWFVTGKSGPNEVNWNTLVSWAGPGNIAKREIAVDWRLP
jgi:hypothetical protein